MLTLTCQQSRLLPGRFRARDGQAVAHPCHRLDREAARRLGVGDPAQMLDAAIDGVVSDCTTRPAPVDERRPGHQLTACLSQGAEHLHDPWLEPHAFSGDDDLTGGRNNARGAEIERRLSRQVDPPGRRLRPLLPLILLIGKDRQEIGFRTFSSAHSRLFIGSATRSRRVGRAGQNRVHDVQKAYQRKSPHGHGSQPAGVECMSSRHLGWSRLGLGLYGHAARHRQ